MEATLGSTLVTEADEDERTDAELLAAVRAGDCQAGGELFRRHVSLMRRVAAGLVRQQAERDDLVAEAFARVLSTVAAGGGPESNAPAYLVATMRNLFARWSRHENRIDLYATVPEPVTLDGGADELAVMRSEDRLVWSAYRTLPGRWRTVLWRMSAEGDTPAELAPVLGVSPNGVAVLARRAREGLRQAYLQVQVPDAELPQCQEVRRRMGAWLRGTLPARRAGVLAGHLAVCEPCHAVAAELAEVNRELPRMTGCCGPAIPEPR
ncbi:sigma-70 family RNA polymerase sigma factor [Amycolatopsis rubida]|uniref:RNA polymerase sigma factor, sigma-70 family n=1 Tax=Amycolatopsis rubida TaxID=112413 RepID=A0A1I5I0G9_9PSEU|nr:sigma-70 family RNA polymerase sigma factor [Amycolatopsis rubida]SFO54045.1 RNA polymerase sigma factor, sigma-70 family [Amycolatopsis rubida]